MPTSQPAPGPQRLVHAEPLVESQLARKVPDSATQLGAATRVDTDDPDLTLVRPGEVEQDLIVVDFPAPLGPR